MTIGVLGAVAISGELCADCAARRGQSRWRRAESPEKGVPTRRTRGDPPAPANRPTTFAASPGQRELALVDGKLPLYRLALTTAFAIGIFAGIVDLVANTDGMRHFGEIAAPHVSTVAHGPTHATPCAAFTAGRMSALRTTR